MSQKQFKESLDEMEKFLQEENVGYLGLSVDDEPYVLPLNYGYVRGKILFHGALTGKKLDYLRANPKVCFTVGRQAGKLVRHPQGALCHVENDSVVCYGVARIIEDIKERVEVLNTFNHCFQPDAEDITLEAASGCIAIEIKISEMTGRSQRGLTYTYYHYSFKT
jgi:nitroimidazol reductase NimA-like FMN-containing flavoprotein (pyridoxamine 5'-phosphate oxidase superfamily)